MPTDRIIFWTLASAGAVVAGWWLAVRPTPRLRDLATPVSFLTIIVAILLSLLVFTGQDLTAFGTDAYQLAFGR